MCIRDRYRNQHAGVAHQRLHLVGGGDDLDAGNVLFFAVGHISQVKGTQRISTIRGLTVTHPLLGWGLVAGVIAIAGMPPFGVFMSEFLVVSSTFARQPLLALVVVVGLLLAFGTLLWRLHGLAFGVPDNAPVVSIKASTFPMLLHLTLVFLAGIWLPGPLVAWFNHVAVLLG